MSSYLKTLRKNKKLKTEEVARELNVSQGYYSHIENGTRTPPPEILEKIAKFYEVRKSVLEKEINKGRPQLVASMHWIWKIKIKNMFVLEAIKKDPFILRGQYNEEELVTYFIKLIEFNIGDSIRKELAREMDGNRYLKKFLLDKLHFKNEIKRSEPDVNDHRDTLNVFFNKNSNRKGSLKTRK